MSSLDARKFIILQEDEKGFSFNNKKPSGYTKVDEKNSKFRICYFLQNLDKNNIYVLSLIIKSDDKIEIISIGDIKVDSNGKFEAYYDIDENIIENIYGSTVCVKNSKGGVNYPLSGFLPKKKIINWKTDQYRTIKNKPLRKDMGEKKRANQHSVLQEEAQLVNENMESIYKNDEIEICGDFIEDLSENNEEKIVFDENHKFIDNVIIDDLCLTSRICKCEEDSNKNIYQNHEEKIKCVVDKSKECYDKAKYYIDEIKKLIVNDKEDKIEKLLKSIIPVKLNRNIEIPNDYDYRFFLNILEEFHEINVLQNDEYRFFKVNVNGFNEIMNCDKYDESSYAVVYEPMLYMYPYFQEYKYFIVGIRYNKIEGIFNLVYGVPVKEGNESDLPYDGETGFKRYIYDIDNSCGYHIMEYDYKQLVVK